MWVQVGDADGLGSHAELQAKGADPQGCTVADAGEHQVVGFPAAYMCSEILDKESHRRSAPNACSYPIDRRPDSRRETRVRGPAPF